MRKTLLLLAGCSLTLTSLADEIRAQGCCTPGTATRGGIERGVAPFKTLIGSLSYQNNNLEDAYESTRHILDPLGRTATVEVVNVEVEYGLTDRSSLVLIASYLNKSRELRIKSDPKAAPETARFAGSGFGDAVLLGKYRIISPTLTSPLEIALGAGAKLPVGRYRQEVNGTRLSIDLQAGTGAADLLAWGFLLRSIPQRHLRFFSSALYRYAGTNFEGYKFGDELLVNFGAEYGALDYLDLSLHLKARFAKRDFSDGRLLQSTGGEMYSIAPSFVYHEGNFALRGFVQLPVHRNVRGIQLSLTRLLGVEFQYVLDLRNEGDLRKSESEAAR